MADTAGRLTILGLVLFVENYCDFDFSDSSEDLEGGFLEEEVPLYWVTIL